MPFSDLANRVAEVHGRIAAAVARGGHGQSVVLVAVTKTHGPDAVEAAVRVGIPDVGENRVQEALPKMDAVTAPARWHLIGHIQRNKLHALPRFVLTHSLDRASLADAVRLANASPYALGSAVFTKRRGAGMRAARSLRAGMTSVNSALAFAAVPALPFGGSGESGFGRIHGADGLREFSRAKSITRQRMKPLVRTTTFSREQRDMDRIVKLVTVLHGRLYQPKRRKR